MIVKVPFGPDTVAVDLRGLRVRPLQPSAPRGVRDVGRLVSRAVDFPLDGPGLRDLAAGRRSAVLVVPDGTRRASLPEVLPVIVNRLLAAGIDAGSMTVLVACGTHPATAAEELLELVGKLPHGVVLRQHEGADTTALTTVGELRPGLPLRLDREAVETDLLVTVGAVRHHYFAGFGGGPKMVFPGIAGPDEIQANHSLVLRRVGDSVERDPGCEPGRLNGNPVAVEIARAADLRPPDFAVCLVPGRAGGVAFAASGSWRRAFDAAVERVREWYEIPRSGFDRLVAGAGGPPGDSTLIQAHKSLDSICRFANPDAEILFVAELAAGPGSKAMTPFLADPIPAAILDRLRAGYVQYGHTTLRIVEKTTRHRIYLKSTLDRELARRLGFIPIDDLDEIASRWRAAGFRDHVAVMAEAPVWPRRGSEG
jgi:nickel-dependent lactate racemase